MRPRVVLDTNMCLVPFQFGVDVFEEIERILPGAEVCVPRKVVEELERLEARGGKTGKMARLALKLLRMRGVKVIDVEAGGTDTTLVLLAEKGYIVATNDRELKRRVWKVGGKVLALRERSHLELT